MTKDIIFEECGYKFKGNSCEDCPLECMYKNKSQVIKQLQQENNELKQRLSRFAAFEELGKLEHKLNYIKETMKKDIEIMENGDYDKRDFIIDLKDYIRYIESEQ